jgi:hypothetical protein
MRRTIATLTGILVTAGLLAACGGTDEPPAADEPTVEATEAASPSSEPADDEDADGTDGEDDPRVQQIQEMIALSSDVDSFDEVGEKDPTSWEALVTGWRVQGDTVYVTLQVGPDEPDRDDVGEAAARELSGAAYGVDDVSWIVVEDSTGVVITQEQPFGA